MWALETDSEEGISQNRDRGRGCCVCERTGGVCGGATRSASRQPSQRAGDSARYLQRVESGLRNWQWESDEPWKRS